METLKVRIKENSLMAKLGAKNFGTTTMAVVFGNVIHLHGVNREQFLQSVRWVRHEIRHVRQYRQYGFWPFLWKYVVDWFKYTYEAIPFEVEAFDAEVNEKELDGVEFI